MSIRRQAFGRSKAYRVYQPVIVIGCDVRDLFVKVKHLREKLHCLTVYKDQCFLSIDLDQMYLQNRLAGLWLIFANHYQKTCLFDELQRLNRCLKRFKVSDTVIPSKGMDPSGRVSH